MEHSRRITAKQRLAGYRRNRPRAARSAFERELLVIAGMLQQQLRDAELEGLAWKEGYLIERDKLKDPQYREHLPD